jgi:hypothetical protein
MCSRSEELEVQLAQLEEEVARGTTACVTFGLPSSTLAEGAGILRQELAAAANIRSRV